MDGFECEPVHDGIMLDERVWVLATDRSVMNAVRHLGPRRSRLLAVACCRVFLPCVDPLVAGVAASALDAAEAFAEPGKLKATLKRAKRDVAAARGRIDWRTNRPLWEALSAVEESASEQFTHRAVVSEMAAQALMYDAGSAARLRLYNLYRDVAGCPPEFSFDPAWRTSTALALAEQMYESRDFAAMPILSDALQDAGCESDSVLSHCRGDGPHVRGCWVIDGILGKG